MVAAQFAVFAIIFRPTAVFQHKQAIGEGSNPHPALAVDGDIFRRTDIGILVGRPGAASFAGAIFEDCHTLRVGHPRASLRIDRQRGEEIIIVEAAALGEHGPGAAIVHGDAIHGQDPHAAIRGDSHIFVGGDAGADSGLCIGGLPTAAIEMADALEMRHPNVAIRGAGQRIGPADAPAFELRPAAAIEDAGFRRTGEDQAVAAHYDFVDIIAGDFRIFGGVDLPTVSAQAGQAVAGGAETGQILDGTSRLVGRRGLGRVGGRRVAGLGRLGSRGGFSSRGRLTRLGGAGIRLRLGLGGSRGQVGLGNIGRAAGRFAGQLRQHEQRQQQHEGQGAARARRKRTRLERHGNLQNEMYLIFWSKYSEKASEKRPNLTTSLRSVQALAPLHMRGEGRRLPFPQSFGKAQDRRWGKGLGDEGQLIAQSGL